MSSDRPSANQESTRRVSTETILWLGAFLVLAVWVVWRCGGFDLAESVTVNGQKYLNGYATVDHPFHTMRAYQLIESLREGEILRWVMSHQGGYPVEFYPIGVAWIEAGIWALSFGSLSIFVVHKLTILLVFLLPGLGYWILARGDRRSPGAGFLALALHIGIAGYWMAGGYTEGVSWGLVTNVTGATAALIATGALARYVIRREAAMGVVAITAIALSAYANPRSLIAVGVAGVAVGISALLGSNAVRQSWRSVAIRIGSVAILAAMIAATELLTLVRYRDLYYFVNYEQYDATETYWSATVNAVTSPVIWLAVAGGIWAMLSRRFAVARVAAIALGLYVLVTLFFAGEFGEYELIQQLEAPRLMPYQRLLMLYLAAFFVARLIDLAAGLFRVGAARGIATVATSIVVLVVFVRPVGDISEEFQGLPAVAKMSMTEMEMFRGAIREADEVAPDGTAILVLGTKFSWHERLWASLETDKPLYYEHWLWSWNNEHAGPPPLSNGQCTFDNDIGNYYPCPEQALTPEYLAGHGIGAVVVTNVNSHDTPDDARDVAESAQALTEVSKGPVWDVYAVTTPSAIVTDGDAQPTAISIENESIEATFAEGSGDILVRVNWFPRWEATVNGESVEVERGPGGYMTIDAPEGEVDLELTYARTPLDWLTRLAALLGVLGTAALWLYQQRKPAA
jgi:hypothetical protein